MLYLMEGGSMSSVRYRAGCNQCGTTGVMEVTNTDWWGSLLTSLVIGGVTFPIGVLGLFMGSLWPIGGLFLMVFGGMLLGYGVQILRGKELTPESSLPLPRPGRHP